MLLLGPLSVPNCTLFSALQGIEGTLRVSLQQTSLGEIPPQLSGGLRAFCERLEHLTGLSGVSCAEERCPLHHPDLRVSGIPTSSRAEVRSGSLAVTTCQVHHPDLSRLRERVGELHPWSSSDGDVRVGRGRAGHMPRSQTPYRSADDHSQRDRCTEKRPRTGGRIGWLLLPLGAQDVVIFRSLSPVH